MRRVILSAVLVIIAVAFQLTLANRLALPGGGQPDLVLLVVIGLALSGGPAAGALTGFAAGLCLDLAPPGSPLLGEYALVLCLIGYGCGLLHPVVGRPARVGPVLLACGIIAAAAGEALAAALTMALSPGSVSLAAARQLLPAAVLADAVASVVVLPLVVLAARLADGPVPVPDAAKPTPAAIRERQQASAEGAVARPGGKPRRGPRLRGSHVPGDGWIGRAQQSGAVPAPRAPGGAPWLRAGSRASWIGAEAAAAGSAGAAQQPRRSVPPVRLRLGRGRPGGPVPPPRPARRAALPRISFSAASTGRTGLGRARPLTPSAGHAGGLPVSGRLRRPRGAALRGGYAGGSALRSASASGGQAGGFAASGQAHRTRPALARAGRPVRLRSRRRDGLVGGGPPPPGRRVFRRPATPRFRARLRRRRRPGSYRGGAVARLRMSRRPWMPRWAGRLRRDRASGWRGTRQTGGSR
ncbi:MAG: rod shape-determining protein MreD [Streptosporangiaceae bacterium]